MMDTKGTQHEAMAPIRELLAGLEPEDELVIQDSVGTSHTIRTTLPARRHIKVLRLLDSIVQKVGDDADEKGGGVRRMIAGLRKAVHNDEAVELLGKTFAEAYPEAVQAAGGGDPLDLFPLDAIMESLLPLLSRLLAKALAMADRSTAGQKKITTQSES
jgi:hypothetical protein